MKDLKELAQVLEAVLLTSSEARNIEYFSSLFDEADRPSSSELKKALKYLANTCGDRAVELKKVASGYRLQIRESLMPWLHKSSDERPQRYSRAFLETLALIAYKQPVTRGEIEAIRGVSVNSTIIKSFKERRWIRVVGHKDVPGKPAMLATTSAFLDYFNLSSLEELPTLLELQSLGEANNRQESLLSQESIEHSISDASKQVASPIKSFHNLLEELDQIESNLVLSDTKDDELSN
ncbi:UNVERIFIED_CONTAM: hypothetical protein GTU68_055918 [Idotea baltica]|nr:hypothetical protein [Idotea baltica]